jgi:SET domain-containing protein
MKTKPFKPTKKHIKTKLDEQVNLLNEIVKIKLAPSSIHGVGVFAMRDIKKGEKLYTDIIPHQFDLPYSMFKKLDPEISEILLGHFPLITKGSHFMYPVNKMSAYLNHSMRPNYDAISDEALEDIPKGKEITEDYRKIENWNIVFPWLIRDLS